MVATQRALLGVGVAILVVQLLIWQAIGGLQGVLRTQTDDLDSKLRQSCLALLRIEELLETPPPRPVAESDPLVPPCR